MKEKYPEITMLKHFALSVSAVFLAIISAVVCVELVKLIVTPPNWVRWLILTGMFMILSLIHI